MYMKKIAVVTTGSFVFFGMCVWYLLPNANVRSVSNTVTTPVNEGFTLSSSTVRIPARGLAESAKTAVVAAKRAGVVSDVFVRAGDSVSSGSMLVQQTTPVVTAQAAEARARASLRAIERSADVDARTYTAAKAHVTAYSAAELAQMRRVQTEIKVDAQLVAVRAAMEQSLTTILDALSFVHAEPAVFADKEQRQFSQVTNMLYEQVPVYLQSDVQYNERTDSSHSSNVVARIERLRATATADLSVVETQSLAGAVLAQLRALLNVYETAESTVFDSARISRTAPRYQSYLKNRQSIQEALVQLGKANTSLRDAVHMVQQQSVQGTQNVAVSALDEARAKQQTVFAHAIASATKKVASAERGVFEAKRELGRVAAPFSGVIADVLVDPGEYATPGTPLMKVMGGSGREMTIMLPAKLASSIKPGADFFVRDEILGRVDRVYPVREGASIRAVVRFHGAAAVDPGQTISGHIRSSLNAKQYVIPRRYIRFGSGGPYVETSNKKTYEVTILHDMGDRVVARVPEAAIGSTVVANRGFLVP
jgi:multidrug resistance efflux pump